MAEDLSVFSLQETEVLLEVAEHLGDSRVRAVCLGAIEGCVLGAPVWDTGAPLTVPVGPGVLGRVLGATGLPIDGHGPVQTRTFAPVHAPSPVFSSMGETDDIVITGIKAIDLLAPFARGGNSGLLGGSGTGKTAIIMELLNNISTNLGGYSVIAGVGNRTNEMHDLYDDLRCAGVMCARWTREEATSECMVSHYKSKATLVLSHMGEPPGARARVALTGLAIAEYFRDVEGNDVLLFIDDVFRFSQVRPSERVCTFH